MDWQSPASNTLTTKRNGGACHPTIHPMKTNLIGRKARITETTNGEISRQFDGEIVAVGYHGGEQIKSWQRGFDLLILTERGKLIRASSALATIL